MHTEGRMEIASLYLQKLGLVSITRKTAKVAEMCGGLK
jgi:hypothetical protein